MLLRKASTPAILISLALVLGLATTALAQPASVPFGTSAYFSLNTNRIGFADSEVLAVVAAPNVLGLPEVVALGDPLPNPFNPRVSIPFSVGRRGVVELRVYDVRGRQVREMPSREFAVGSHSWQWDGRSDQGTLLPSGVYLVRIRLGETREAKKISLVK